MAQENGSHQLRATDNKHNLKMPKTTVRKRTQKQENRNHQQRAAKKRVLATKSKYDIRTPQNRVRNIAPKQETR